MSLRAVQPLRTPVITVGLAPLSAGIAFGQVKTNVPDVVPGAGPATVEHITIHGKALERNLEGDAVDRTVLVFLPPSYARERTRRYPVVYALHGYSIGAELRANDILGAMVHGGSFTPNMMK